MGRLSRGGSVSKNPVTGSLDFVDNKITTLTEEDLILNPSGTGTVVTNSLTTLTGGIASSDTSTGDLIVDGGVGVSGNVNASNGVFTATSIDNTSITNISANFTNLEIQGVATLAENRENFTIISGATGVVVHDLNNGNNWIHNSIAGNFTANFTNGDTTDNRRIEINLVLNQGATPYYCTAVQVDGVAYDINWSGYGTPTSNANQKEIQNISIVRTSGSVLVFSTLVSLGLVKDGSTADRAGVSAAQIKADTGTNTNGVYWIDLPTVGPTQIYCLMDSGYDGGGWMLAMKATRGNTFEYSSNYWTTSNTLNPTAVNLTDGDAKYETFNRFEARDLMARFPDIGQGGSLSYGGAWIWLQRNFYYQLGQKSTLVNLFNTASRYFIQDARQFNGWGNGVWSSQVDVRFYGFNYFNDQPISNGTRTRWGFGWNENGGGLFPNGNMGSDDVAGGIGMNGVQQNTGAKYSAGDVIGCCQDTSGINRSARVEMYVR